MLYWVIVTKEGLREIFYGTEGEVRAKGASAIYGPFGLRRGAKGCVLNLESTESSVREIAEKSRVIIQEPKPVVADEPQAEQPKTAKPGKKK